MMSGVLEQERSHSLLDDDRSSTVFDLADDASVATLATEQRSPCHR